MAEDSDDTKAGKRPNPHQFQPGKSGNPRGRPPEKKRGPQDISALLNQPVPVKRGRGKAKNMAMFEHNLRRLSILAIKERKLDAILEFLQTCEDYGLLARPRARACGGNLTFPKNEDYKAFLEWSSRVAIIARFKAH
jgi:hypothetical protein